MPIDNDVYDRLGAGWWDEDNPLNMLHGSCTPGRMGFFREILDHRGVVGGRALDIGCGAGFIAEELAMAGFTVTGIDPSRVAIDTARAHAGEGGLDIEYRVGVGEELPFADAAFDLVFCCDVLEHVRDLDRVIAETARVMRPGGLYLFDTINRTWRSKMLAIKAMQEWRLTRIMDTAIHEWSMFITPDELGATLGRHGLDIVEVVGLAPRARWLTILAALGDTRRGRISYGELSRRLEFGRVTSLSLSYMGFAVRRP
ncbi:bifunctional 2-polyprenyl-6-hydroxyphenol methylase/3-demethylubiquinol 3-O-methyltransferase UbiG [Agromyces sp. SYSU K20354]|uniref:bifunctional 2-polyprenyl-6-hydroxyphenol methylase/3-demethylubiquinol 3-O-methyltransferase UbiG n=1 Tax=Agromyces cavernae TaxID=2898659 RepID=UPI001E5A44D1|nr:bifunctional 2-polyprenyl-6-hydroxyphenol methylase/3-demethylubiquinol 3-O-methyltransferase UbiG [Agromyces cavernae]MCD2441035.1 bifunctional 2-polyprenyl-6-hydroxyphenol methylase/3-demethylubiquinol 3-O-methyltransferase UbiG [Agromyces cavernae]